MTLLIEKDKEKKAYETERQEQGKAELRIKAL